MPTTNFPEYEWDATKAAANLQKHGVSFERAPELGWDQAIVTEDRRKPYGERRYVAYAPIGERLYVAVYSSRGSRRRIISLRKANTREIMRYQNAQEA